MDAGKVILENVQPVGWNLLSIAKDFFFQGNISKDEISRLENDLRGRSANKYRQSMRIAQRYETSMGGRGFPGVKRTVITP